MQKGVNQTDLKTLHDLSKKPDEREAFELGHLMHRGHELALPLLPLPDELAKKTNSFEILSQLPEKLPLVEHFSNLVLGFLDDGRAHGFFFLLLLLLLAVVRVLLRRFRRPVVASCFGKLERKTKLKNLELSCFDTMGNIQSNSCFQTRNDRKDKRSN